MRSGLALMCVAVLVGCGGQEPPSDVPTSGPPEGTLVAQKTLSSTETCAYLFHFGEGPPRAATATAFLDGTPDYRLVRTVRQYDDGSVDIDCVVTDSSRCVDNSDPAHPQVVTCTQTLSASSSDSARRYAHCEAFTTDMSDTGRNIKWWVSDWLGATYAIWTDVVTDRSNVGVMACTH
jgi:hypothetical protein